MGMNPPGRNRERGVALIMAIIMMAVCLVIVVGLTQYIIVDYRATHQDWRRVQALYNAEAGLDVAAYYLPYWSYWDWQANPTLSFGLSLPGWISGAGGYVNVQITKVPNDPIGTLKIVSTGQMEDMTRTIVAGYGQSTWDFGLDAVRSRAGVTYASNEYMTVVVDESYRVIEDVTVDASIRVTGTGATIGAVDSIAANKAKVAGKVSAPGWVDVNPENARSVSELSPDNYMPNAFPDSSILGRWDASGNLIFPPTSGTWASMYYQDALAGGTSYASTGSFTGSKFINLGGTGTLHDATLIGPGTVFVYGNVGGNVTNGAPPVTLAVSGNFETGGSDYYRFNAGSDMTTPSIVVFGKLAEITGNAFWYLNGALMMLNPSGEISINDSAIGAYGSLVSNGTVAFKSSKGALGYPRGLSGRKAMMRGLPKINSYVAR